jgi:hypothetical protein
MARHPTLHVKYIMFCGCHSAATAAGTVAATHKALHMSLDSENQAMANTVRLPTLHVKYIMFCGCHSSATAAGTATHIAHHLCFYSPLASGPAACTYLTLLQGLQLTRHIDKPSMARHLTLQVKYIMFCGCHSSATAAGTSLRFAIHSTMLLAPSVSTV